MNELESIVHHRYLPPELWTEHILPRLPVKSVLVCRSVCRTWCAAIDNPIFVGLHFKLSKNNHEKNLLIAVEKLGRYGIDGCRLTIRHGDAIRKCADIYRAYGRYDFSTRCNGLMFVQDNNHMQDLKVWNPSIRKSLTIPPCPLVNGCYGIKYLFGYRPSGNDYVVYAFCVDQKDNDAMSTFVAVYTMSDNLWRIQDYKMNLPSWLFKSFEKAMCDENCVFVDGVLHWLRKADSYYHQFKEHCLVSFDFDVGQFKFLEVSYRHPIIEHSSFRFLFNFGEKLAIFCISSLNITIWVLKDNMWYLKFVGKESPPELKYIWDHPGLVANFIYLKDDDITFVYGKIAYNIKTHNIQPVTTSLTSRLMLDTYIETMVLHRGFVGQVLTLF